MLRTTPNSYGVFESSRRKLKQFARVCDNCLKLQCDGMLNLCALVCKLYFVRACVLCAAASLPSVCCTCAIVWVCGCRSLACKASLSLQKLLQAAKWECAVQQQAATALQIGAAHPSFGASARVVHGVDHASVKSFFAVGTQIETF